MAVRKMWAKLFKCFWSFRIDAVVFSAKWKPHLLRTLQYIFQPTKIQVAINLWTNSCAGRSFRLFFNGSVVFYQNGMKLQNWKSIVLWVDWNETKTWVWTSNVFHWIRKSISHIKIFVINEMARLYLFDNIECLD